MSNSFSNQYLNERNQTVRMLRALAARERRWLVEDPDEDRRDSLHALEWAAQHLEGLPENWITADETKGCQWCEAPTHGAGRCVWEIAGITLCTSHDSRHDSIEEQEGTKRTVTCKRCGASAWWQPAEKASAPPPFAIGTRVRFIDSTSDHAEWVVYRLHDGWVHLHAADDRTYTHFAKPEQLRAVKVNAVPTQEWLDKSQGLTGLQYDEHGERMPEKATGDQS